VSAREKSLLSYAEYLAAEATAEVRHEFINGEAFAMAGGTPRHGALAATLARLLGNALAGKRCQPFSSDVRVQVERTGASFYPDLSVVCGKLERAPNDPHALTNPVVLVEVLSETSEAYDRGVKASHYRRLPSLREYVLVSQDLHRVEVQRLNERGIWELHFFAEGEQVRLESLDVSFSLDALYVDPLAS
jgi:Uma2 family endonuclease